MTFADWLAETRELYRTESVGPATAQSLNALRMGAQRRLDQYIGHSPWDRGDWDVLVILDATRADLWRDVAPEYGLTDLTAWSNAAASIDWIRRNISQRPERDRLIYVTGNPFADHDSPNTKSADLSKKGLAHFAPLYRDGWQDIGNGVWTIPPRELTDYAIAAWRNRERLGGDRMIIHYMQPHQPFRGMPDGHGIEQNMQALAIGEERGKHGAGAWDRLREGVIDEDELWSAYEDNLRWVLDDVTERLLPNLDAEVVISSDHGNAMGEWGVWGHPPGAVAPPVRCVPWAPVITTDEETIEPANVLDRTFEATDVEDRLDALGYIEP